MFETGEWGTLFTLEDTKYPPLKDLILGRNGYMSE